jgi:hypothetical protein
MLKEAPATDASTGLSQLLETEARLEALLEDARRQADAVVHDAEARAWASLEAVDRELAEVATRASQEQAEAVAQRIEALNLKREQALRRIRAIDDAQISVLAEWVSAQVLEQLTTSGADP